MRNFRKILNADSENNVYKDFGLIWNKKKSNFGTKMSFFKVLNFVTFFTYTALSLCKISGKKPLRVDSEKKQYVVLSPISGKNLLCWG